MVVTFAAKGNNNIETFAYYTLRSAIATLAMSRDEAPILK